MNDYYFLYQYELLVLLALFAFVLWTLWAIKSKVLYAAIPCAIILGGVALLAKAFHDPGDEFLGTYVTLAYDLIISAFHVILIPSSMICTILITRPKDPTP
ncbi:hypothetical protein OKA05_27280 [Luteolibacter arcticus]|uniref:Uncharacterized protein n=1 Tax=Luteolibacter arcticus TaxID=1581411 RepID=A0ABT3GS25_9BACT|nr:hypothetical protein [Luteolibacter arcticus]MCW1926287.1 hypothetical protein [Luteolibacter arcticus]